MKRIYIIAALLVFVYGAAMPLICLSSETKKLPSGEIGQNTYDDLADKTKKEIFKHVA